MQFKNTSQEVTRRLHEPRLTLLWSKQGLGCVLSDTLLIKLTSHNVILEFKNFEKWLMDSDSPLSKTISPTLYKNHFFREKAFLSPKKNQT